VTQTGCSDRKRSNATPHPIETQRRNQNLRTIRTIFRCTDCPTSTAVSFDYPTQARTGVERCVALVPLPGNVTGISPAQRLVIIYRYAGDRAAITRARPENFADWVLQRRFRPCPCYRRYRRGARPRPTICSRFTSGRLRLTLPHCLQVREHSNINVGATTVDIGNQSRALCAVAGVLAPLTILPTPWCATRRNPFCQGMVGHGCDRRVIEPSAWISGRPRDQMNDIVQGMCLNSSRRAGASPTIVLRVTTGRIESTLSSILPRGAHRANLYRSWTDREHDSPPVLHNMGASANSP